MYGSRNVGARIVTAWICRLALQVYRPLASLDRELMAVSSAFADMAGLVTLLAERPRIVDCDSPKRLQSAPLSHLSLGVPNHLPSCDMVVQVEF